MAFCTMPCMPSKNPAQRLRDIVDNVDAIAEFTAKRTSQLSSRRLPAEIRDRHGEIDWVAVAAADNVYRHEYETVDETLIWYTVKRVSPPCEVWPLQN